MSLLTPDLCVNSITDVTYKLLNDMGITNLLIDIDETISLKDSYELYEGVEHWFDIMKKNSIGMVLISNNSEQRVYTISNKLNVPYVFRAMKPMGFGINKAFMAIPCKKINTAMVGDQIFTDVLGANLYGIRSILTEPLSKERGIFMKIKRLAERPVRGRIKKYKV